MDLTPKSKAKEWTSDRRSFILRTLQASALLYAPSILGNPKKPTPFMSVSQTLTGFSKLDSDLGLAYWNDHVGKFSSKRMKLFLSHPNKDLEIQKSVLKAWYTGHFYHTQTQDLHVQAYLQSLCWQSISVAAVGIPMGVTWDQLPHTTYSLQGKSHGTL